MTAITTTITKQKKKRRQKTQEQAEEEIFKWAISEFKKAADLFNRRKYEIVLELAYKLEAAGIELSTISTRITKRLKGIVDDDYVREVLRGYPKYKNQSKVKNATGDGTIKGFRRENPANPSQTDNKKETKKEEEQQNESIAESKPESKSQHEQEANVNEEYDDPPIEEFKMRDLRTYQKTFLYDIIEYLYEKVPKEIKDKHK